MTAERNELRDEIAKWLARRDMDPTPTSWHEDAEALMAGPLARLLATLEGEQS